MDVNAAGAASTATAAANTSYTAKANKAEETKTKEPEQESYKYSGDKSEVSKPDSKKLSELLAQSKKQTEAFARMIQKLLSKQGETGKIASDMVEIDEETRLAAQEAISEDGYYGVKQTSQRILDFAVAVAGDDPKKLESMKKAFEKGFQQAMGALGSKKLEDMPQISQDTYAAVMKGFDELMAPKA